jgi:hypothetical protein
MTRHEQQQLHQQAEALYDQYGKPLEQDHWGEYVVIQGWRALRRHLEMMNRRVTGTRIPYVPITVEIPRGATAGEGIE